MSVYIVLDSVAARQQALSVLRTLPVDSGMVMEIKPHAEKRRAEQNRLHWARLTELAEQAKPDGREYEPRVWHEYFGSRWLPPVEFALPNGKILTRRKSTTELSVSEFADFMTQIEVWAAGRNVIFSDGG